MIATAAFVVELAAWGIYAMQNESIDTRWRFALWWKWISGTLLAVSLGRTVYLFVINGLFYHPLELLTFALWTMTWGTSFARCLLVDKRLYEANEEMIEIIAERCCCGGEIECCQKIECVDDEEEIACYYRIYCPKCKEQTEWCESLDSACAEWRKYQMSKGKAAP